VNKNGESKLATSPDPASKSRDGSASRRVSEIPESSTVAIADLAARMRREGHKVVDFSAGRAAEHSPDLACEAAIEAMRSGQTHQTEARGRPEYLQACSEKLQRCNGLTLDPGSNIIATLGCKQGLVLSLLASIDAGDEVIIEDPCFVSYAPTIRLLGGVPVIVPLMPENGFRWKGDDLQNAITDKTRAILYCSPHNPAGVVHTRDDLDVISNIAVQHDLTVIADEIYEAVTWNGRSHIPMFGLPGMESRTIGLMGMTKSYSMGGWRIGYAYAANRLCLCGTQLHRGNDKIAAASDDLCRLFHAAWCRSRPGRRRHRRHAAIVDRLGGAVPLRHGRIERPSTVFGYDAGRRILCLGRYKQERPVIAGFFCAPRQGETGCDRAWRQFRPGFGQPCSDYLCSIVGRGTRGYSQNSFLCGHVVA
jgi:histidinol-phosphate/aromatic aminotransferase/cobyric acid decarboxylase-like protein